MIIRYFNKLIELLPEPVRQFGGLVSLTFIVIFSFAILNAFFGQGEELVEKMKKEEARIVEANKLSKIISTLPSGILTFPDGSTYEGEWANGFMNGKGKFTWSDGKEKIGIWKNGKLQE